MVGDPRVGEGVAGAVGGEVGDDGNPTRKDGGVEFRRVVVLAFEYDLDTHQVAIGGQPMPLSLAQMIAGEGMRVLEEHRKLAALQALQRAAADAALAERVRQDLSKH